MKKFIISLIALFATVGIAQASLWDFYSEQGKTLPTVQDRLPDALRCQIQGYQGTASQNYELEKCLRSGAVNDEVPFFVKLREIKADVGVFGAFNFVQVQDQYLSGSGITSSVTTITIETFDYPDGSNVVMADFGEVGYATLEPNTSREENVSFTGLTQSADNTASLTGVSRGLIMKYPYTASTTQAFAHAGGTILRITNSAPFYNELVAKKNTNIIYGQLTVATTTGPITRLFFGDNNGAYFWYNSTTDQFGWASTTEEYQFGSGGTQFTTNETLKLVSGILGLNTSTIPWFAVNSGKLIINASTTGGIKGDANGIALDEDDNMDWDGTWRQNGELIIGGKSTITNEATSTSRFEFTGDVYNDNVIWNPYYLATTSVATTTITGAGMAIATSTISANLLGNDGVMEINFAGVWRDENTLDTSLSIEYGGQTICNLLPVAGLTGNIYGSCTLVANNLTNAQKGYGMADTLQNKIVFSEIKNLTVDSTVQHNLIIRATGGADAADNITIYMLTVKIINK